MYLYSFHHLRLLTMSAYLLERLWKRIAVASCAITLTLSASSMFAQTAEDSSYSSSAQRQLVASADEGGTPAEPTPQYGNGGYGRGREPYNPHMGKSPLDHLAFEIGGGFNAPIGNDKPYITWGGNFTAGAGWQFNRQFGVLAEYNFMHNKLPGRFLSDVYLANPDLDVSQLGGHSNIWSLTLEPIFYLRPHGVNNAYVIGGGGFYRKVTTFTTPVESYCYSYYYYGYYSCTQNATVGHFSSNQGGMNIGFGFTHALGQDQHAKLFAEARYHWINTPGPEDTKYWGLGTTGLIPVTFGVRW